MMVFSKPFLVAQRIQARFDAAFDATGEQPCAGYIRAKARMFLRIGADAYRASDFFGQPDIRLSQENLAALERGAAEIIEDQGFSASSPLTSLPAEFSHSFANLFHLEVMAQNARRSGDGQYLLDALLCRHMVDGREIILFNRVPGARLRQAMEESS